MGADNEVQDHLLDCHLLDCWMQVKPPNSRLTINPIVQVGKLSTHRVLLGAESEGAS